MAMYAKIRRMYFREHLAISEIQRRTSLSRNTIKKWLKETGEPRYRRPPRDSKLTPFKPSILLALETDAHRPKKDRRTALMLFQAIRKEGYTGCYAQVCVFQTKLDTDSTANWTVIPAQSGHRFHGKLDGL